MTTGLSATFPNALGYPLHLELSRTRAIILALLATLCVALVFTSATWVDRFTAQAPPQPPVATPVVDSGAIGQPENVAKAQATPVAAVEIRPEIETLARLVAKKYRISAEATRGVVGTAYREGHRIGLDPLLILAVIAVESRFNPIAESDSGAMGLMQIIPGYHKDQFNAARGDSVLDPPTNIRVGARVLKEYIRRGGTEIAGLQRYNGSADDASNAYANKVLGEKVRLEQAVQRARDRLRT